LPANKSNWRPCMSRRRGTPVPHHDCSARPPRGERAALTRRTHQDAAHSLCK